MVAYRLEFNVVHPRKMMMEVLNLKKESVDDDRVERRRLMPQLVSWL